MTILPPPRKATPAQKKENAAAIKRIKRAFPSIRNNKDLNCFLMGATAWPFAPLSHCADQAEEAAPKCRGDWNEACALAYEETMAAMRKIHEDELRQLPDGLPAQHEQAALRETQ